MRNFQSHELKVWCCFSLIWRQIWKADFWWGLKHTTRAILWVRSVFRHLSSHVQWKYLNYFCPLNLSNYIGCDFDNRNFSLIEPLLYSVSWKSAKTNIDSKFWILTCRKSLFWNKSNPQQVLFSSTISGRSNFLIHFLGIIPKEGSAGQVWDSWTSQNVLFSLKIFLQRKVTKQFLNVPKGGHCFRNNSLKKKNNFFFSPSSYQIC